MEENGFIFLPDNGWNIATPNAAFHFYQTSVIRLRTFGDSLRSASFRSLGAEVNAGTLDGDSDFYGARCSSAGIFRRAGFPSSRRRRLDALAAQGRESPAELTPRCFPDIAGGLDFCALSRSRSARPTSSASSNPWEGYRSSMIPPNVIAFLKKGPSPRYGKSMGRRSGGRR
jgi:hypothetical protein